MKDLFATKDVRTTACSKILGNFVPPYESTVSRKLWEAGAVCLGEPDAEPDRVLVVGPGDPIFYPPQTSNLHYEGELAVVIGRICRDVPAEQATDVIFGYTIANDVTARDLQRSDVQFTRAKGFDSFCPLGPWVETDLDVSDLRVRTFLNGDLKQDGTTKDLIFDVPTLVSHVSSVMTLLPGDVILTGTPEGVGPMEVGDEVDVVIDGIGTLTNKVVSRD